MNEGSSTGPWEWFKQGFELAKTQKRLAEPLSLGAWGSRFGAEALAVSENSRGLRGFGGVDSEGTTTCHSDAVLLGSVVVPEFMY